MKLYLCHWRPMPEIRCLVAARTRGKAKRVLCDHVSEVFPSCVFVDCYAQRATLDDEQRFNREQLKPHLVHGVWAHPDTTQRGQWQ